MHADGLEEVETAMLDDSFKCFDTKERIEIGRQEARMASKPDCGFFKNWKRFECVETLLGRHR